MTRGDSREEVRKAARRLFAERGYSHVTIRQIAAEAGVSPAMVMKLGGSKQALYAEATPPDPAPLDPDWPRSRIGEELVRRIVDRRSVDVSDPWLQALMAVIDAPDPEAARQQFRDHYVARLTTRILGGAHHDEAIGTSTEESARTRAEMVAAMLIGLACTARTLRLLDDETAWIIARYGAMIQAVIDDGFSPAAPVATVDR